MFQMGKHNVVS